MSSQSKQYIDAVFAAYQDWFGVPSDTFRLKRETGSPELAEIGIIIYLPEPSPDGSTKTLLGTAGMSAKEMNGPVPLAEIGIQIEGSLAPEALKLVAKCLATLASVPFQTGKGYQLNSVLEAIDTPIFGRFDAVYLLEWDPYDRLRPRGFDKAFPLLRLVPIFEQEACFIENAKDRMRAYLALKRKGLNPADFNRSSIIIK